MIPDNHNQKLDLEFREFELILKKMNDQYPQRNLSIPHDLKEVEDIISLATSSNADQLTEKLLKDHLKEKLFFANDTDVEIYQHFRYLPAYWHSHDFIEIACVMEGSCTISARTSKRETSAEE